MIDRPSNDNSPLTARERSFSRIAAAAVLAALSGLLGLQMTGEALAALGGCLGAGLVVFFVWGPIVLRGDTIRLGSAVMVAGLALVASYVGMAIVGGATSRPMGQEAAIALFASMWITAPVVVAAAIGVAVATRSATDRRN